MDGGSLWSRVFVAKLGKRYPEGAGKGEGVFFFFF